MAGLARTASAVSSVGTRPNASANVLVNLLAKGVNTALGVLFMPVYFSILGAAAFGFVGFYSAMQIVVLTAVDFGMSNALIREIARTSTLSDGLHRVKCLYVTFGRLFAVLALFVLGASAIAAPFIARWWLKLQVSDSSTELVIMLVGAAIASYIPFLVPQAVLLGLQRHGSLALVTSLGGVFRSLGAVLVLQSIEPTVVAFLLWQVVAQLLQVAAARLMVRKVLAGAQGAAQWSLVTEMLPFAARLGLLGVAVTVFGQMDRVVLSRMLPLSDYGFYTLAATMYAIPVMIAWPVQTAMFPRLAALARGGRHTEVRETYRSACQFVSATVGPVCLLCATFAPSVLALWTGNPAVVAHAAMLVPWVACSAMFIGLAYLPQALQTAHGWTSLSLILNIAGAILLVPMLVVGTHRAAAVGAVSAVAGVTALYLVLLASIGHNRLLPQQGSEWWLRDVLTPLATSGAVIGFARSRLGVPTERDFATAATLVIVLMVAIASGAVSTPLGRRWCVRMWAAASARRKS